MACARYGIQVFQWAHVQGFRVNRRNLWNGYMKTASGKMWAMYATRCASVTAILTLLSE